MDAWTRSGWIDISRPLETGTPGWPGDRPLRIEQREQDGALLTAISTSCHIGTHLETGRHLRPDEGTVEGIELDRLIGAAEVVEVEVRDGLAVLPEGWSPRAPRVLLRTGSFPLGGEPGEGFAALPAETVGWLADKGAQLIGIDTPSVDPLVSEDLPAHHALADRGMVWIEGLWLGGVEPGLYLMAALPLNLVGAEAAPVRAAVRWIGRPGETAS